MTPTKRSDGTLVQEHLLRETCNVLVLHCHDYSHLTRCIAGRARLELWQDEQRQELISSHELAADDAAVNVPAYVYHEWKALVDNTVIECELEQYAGNV